MNSKEKNYDLSQKVILIAEDDLTSKAYFENALKDTQAKIVTVTNGNEVVQRIRSGEKIDLVRMDIKMPGINGIEATRQIRQFNKDILIILQSAYVLNGQKQQSYEAGCNGFMAKPIRLDDLRKTLSIYLK